MWEEACSWLRGKKEVTRKVNQDAGNEKLGMDQIYWFECIGMFIFVFLQTCTK